MKGIILAGGAGSRLYPMTQVMTKQLQPIYDKPMIYYPLSLLMLSGIKDILIITTENDQPNFVNLLGDGSRFGINIQYEIQNEPKGIAQAYTIGEGFINGDHSIMILGDNLFYGNFQCFRDAIKRQTESNDIAAQIFAYQVVDPERFGVVEFDKNDFKVTSIEEKPANPKSNYAIPGLYIFDGSVSQRARELKPSKRGELEITDLIQTYLYENSLGVEVINRGMAWLDTGTPLSLLEANAFISAIEQRQGLKVACLEEIALRAGFIDIKGFKNSIDKTPKSPYKNYLETILNEYNE